MNCLRDFRRNSNKIFISEGTSCINEVWELSPDGACVPKPDYFQLSCNSHGIGIELSTSVIPEAKNVTVGDCAALLDTESYGLFF